MATNANTPGIPNSPETAAVAMLIGTYIPKLVPKALRKNKKMAPIRIFTALWPTKRSGLVGAPIISSKKINPPSTDMTTIGSILFPLTSMSCTFLCTSYQNKTL
jgi:hypothetical protein